MSSAVPLPAGLVAEVPLRSKSVTKALRPPRPLWRSPMRVKERVVPL